MAYPTVFHLMSAIINDSGASCVLIGGFAVNHYKVTRQTLDIDFLITKESFDQISAQLQQAGFKIDSIEEVFARFKSDDHYMLDVDFMFVEKETLDKIIKGGHEASIWEQRFIVPSLNTLIALKLHAIKYNRKIREYKDFPDIINLIRENKVDFKSGEFRELCLKFGTEELYKKILAEA